MNCVKCGTQLPEGAEFCLKCGLKQWSGNQATASNSKTAVWVAVLLAVILAGFVIWHFTYARNTTEAAKTSAPIPDSAATTQPASSKPDASIPVNKPVALTTQDIFGKASGAMAFIETFDEEGQKRGSGSGFVVASGGITLTNYHVIRGATRATAKFGDGTVSEVNGVIAFDGSHDVAVLKLAVSPKTVLSLGDSDSVVVGQKLIAIGSPLGLQNTVSEGIVSGLRQGIIQMSDPISPGSSGGAVLDTYGQVVGISVASMTAGQNLNFAVPIKWATPYLKSEAVRTFAEVTAENTVTSNVLDGSLSIPAGQVKSWNFAINPNAMNNGHVDGEVTSSGGMGGKITLSLYMQGQKAPIYSCRDTRCAIHQQLAAPGIYILSLDNRQSIAFARSISGKLSMKFTR